MEENIKMNVTKEELEKLLEFQEKYFQHEIHVMDK